jgi:choline O-acetyltransferase
MNACELQVYQFWLDDMYMKVRLPLPINSNPGMVFPRQEFADRSEQLRYVMLKVSYTLTTN